MRTRKNTVCVLAISSIIGMSVAGCGASNGNENENGSGAGSIAISSAVTSLSAFGQTHFIATISGTSAHAVIWQVNGVTGGNLLTTGSIVADKANPLQGDYTAPPKPPATNDGQVTITALSPTDPKDVSNSETLTILPASQGFVLTPTQATIPGGASQTFIATLNGMPDNNTQWVQLPQDLSFGALCPTGSQCVFVAPILPPLGNLITIQAEDPIFGITATATITIDYSDASFTGTFVFSYKGQDSMGYLAGMGSFITNGKGNITSGVEDVKSGGSTAPVERNFTGSYSITDPAHGRGELTLSTGEVMHFVLQAIDEDGFSHGLIMRFDGATASGTIDQQNSSQFTLPAIIANGFVFSLSGVDQNGLPLGVAGAFGVNGNGGFSDVNPSVIDINDNRATSGTTNDTSLTGTYALDPNESAFGRGTITLTSNGIGTLTGTAPGTLTFAFYIVGGEFFGSYYVTRIKLIEIDSTANLVGDVVSSQPINLFRVFPGSDYLFTTAGASASGGFANGGIFEANGSGGIIGGILDVNNSGAVSLAQPLSVSGYSVDLATGRILLSLTANGNTSNYAVYETGLRNGSALLLEMDSNAVACGVAFPATSGPVLNLSGDNAINLTTAFVQNDEGLLGQMMFNGNNNVPVNVTGTLDANDFDPNGARLFPNVTFTNSTASAPDPNIFGRGTMTATITTSPPAQYNFVYYLVGPEVMLLLDVDSNRVATGIVSQQF